MAEPVHYASRARRVFSVLVGLFATWELFYLPAANLIDFVPRRTHGAELEPISDPYQVSGSFTRAEPLQRAGEYAGDVLDFWSELTGQEQGWSLFAPGTPPYSVFPAVEFRFADGTSDTLLSPFEPADKLHPRLRLPLLDDRPFNFEAQFMYPVWFAPPDAVEQYPEFYRDLPDTARAWQVPIRAWLAWRWKEYRATHPDCGRPVEVILKHRFIATPKPGAPADWTQPPQERPFARWYPATDAFDAYDAVNRRFVSVRRKP